MKAREQGYLPSTARHVLEAKISLSSPQWGNQTKSHSHAPSKSGSLPLRFSFVFDHDRDIFGVPWGVPVGVALGVLNPRTLSSRTLLGSIAVGLRLSMLCVRRPELGERGGGGGGREMNEETYLECGCISPEWYPESRYGYMQKHQCSYIVMDQHTRLWSTAVWYVTTHQRYLESRYMQCS